MSGHYRDFVVHMDCCIQAIIYDINSTININIFPSDLSFKRIEVSFYPYFPWTWCHQFTLTHVHAYSVFITIYQSTMVDILYTHIYSTSAQTYLLLSPHFWWILWSAVNFCLYSIDPFHGWEHQVIPCIIYTPHSWYSCQYCMCPTSSINFFQHA